MMWGIIEGKFLSNHSSFSIMARVISRYKYCTIVGADLEGYIFKSRIPLELLERILHINYSSLITPQE